MPLVDIKCIINMDYDDDAGLAQIHAVAEICNNYFKLKCHPEVPN